MDAKLDFILCGIFRAASGYCGMSVIPVEASLMASAWLFDGRVGIAQNLVLIPKYLASAFSDDRASDLASLLLLFFACTSSV